jgi:hypothetical protein
VEVEGVVSTLRPLDSLPTWDAAILVMGALGAGAYLFAHLGVR